MSWTSTPTWVGPTRRDGPYLVRDEAAASEEWLLRVREPKATHTHIHVGAARPRRARTSDAVAPVAQSMREADPATPGSGTQPKEAGWTVDFKRGADGRWRGQDRAGRKYRLLMSDDTYRVRSDENDEAEPLPPGVQPMMDRRSAARRRLGDAALASPAAILSDEQQLAGLESWKEKIEQFWKRG